MKSKRPIIYLHMSVRVLLTAAVFIALGAGILYFLIEGDYLNLPVTEEDILIGTVLMPEDPPAETLEATASTVSVDANPVESGTSSAVARISEYALLSPGDDNRAVASLRERLEELGYLEPDISSTVYNTAVQAAVSLFQRCAGMEITGIADTQLQKLLFSEAAPTCTARSEDTGEDIACAQLRLKELGYYSAYTTGYFGPQTKDALIRFETRSGLTADGILDRTDKKFLFGAHAAKSETFAGEVSDFTLILTPSNDGAYSGSAEEFARATAGQLHKPYARYTQGPDTFDGPGLIRYCLGLAGIQTGRLDAAGYAEIAEWEKISSIDALKRGDLLFFKDKTGTDITGIGIFTGSDGFIYASSAKGEVTSASLTEDYWKAGFVFARRIFHG